VNLAPIREGRYRVIVAFGAMDSPADDERMRADIRGWFIPRTKVESFLVAYSNQAGTHHNALIYSTDHRPLETLAVEMGWEYVELK